MFYSLTADLLSSLMDITCPRVCVCVCVCVCVSRGLCLEEETCVCAGRPSGQRGHGCVGYQSNGQEQDDAAALHICGVGSIHIYKHLTCSRVFCFQKELFKDDLLSTVHPDTFNVSFDVPFSPETSMATCCGAERDIFPAPCPKPSPAVSRLTSAISHWISRLLPCPSDPGTVLI